MVLRLEQPCSALVPPRRGETPRPLSPPLQSRLLPLQGRGLGLSFPKDELPSCLTGSGSCGQPHVGGEESSVCQRGAFSLWW